MQTPRDFLGINSLPTKQLLLGTQPLHLSPMEPSPFRSVDLVRNMHVQCKHAFTILRCTHVYMMHTCIYNARMHLRAHMH
jgi:hypothetical protein